MHRTPLYQPIIVGVLVLFVVVGCSAATTTSFPPSATSIPPTATLFPPTALSVPTLPVTTALNCWTVATVVEPGSPAKLGGTSVPVAFADYAYDGIVGGGGFVIPSGGHIGHVTLGGKAVTLTSHDFGKGSIDTQEFGKMDVLFKANVASECALLVATPEQLSKLAEWIRSAAASVPPTLFAAKTLPPQPSPTFAPSRTPAYAPAHTPMLSPILAAPVEGVYKSLPLLSSQGSVMEQVSLRVVGNQVSDIKLVFLGGGNTTCTLTASGSVPIQKDLSFTTEGYLPDDKGIVVKGRFVSLGSGSTATVEWNATTCGTAGKLPKPSQGLEMLHWLSEGTSTPSLRPKT